MLISVVLVLMTIASVSANDSLDDADILADSSESLSVEVDKYYVDSNAATTGDGSQSSPFKTIGEAVDLTAANKTVEIYLAAGLYGGENNTNFEITQNHYAGGGSISVIGADSGVTIDLTGANIFMKMSRDSNLTVKNIKFTNLYSQNSGLYGYVIRSQGCVIVDNCEFVDSGSGALHSEDTLIVTNSKFDNLNSSAISTSLYNYMTSSPLYITVENCNFTNIDNVANVINLANSLPAINKIANCLFENNVRAINIGAGTTYVDNCKFINNTAYLTSYNYGGAIIAGSTSYVSNTYITNCEFIENTATNDLGGAIYAQSNVYLSNNAAINNHALNGDFLYVYNNPDNLKNTTYVTVLNNKTIEITSPSMEITATVCDDMGNSISGGKMTLFIDDTQIGQPEVINGTVKYVYNAFLVGNHTVSAKYNTNCMVYTATLVCNPESNKKIYVSKDGNDDTGDGSEAKPYASIEKGMEVAKDIYNSTVYIKGGTYDYQKYAEFTINGFKLNMIGYDGEVVIDMKNTVGFGVFNNGEVSFENLKFINGYKTYKSREIGIINTYVNQKATFINCTFENNKPYRGAGVIYGHADEVISCTFNNNPDSFYDVNAYGFTTNIVNSTFYGVAGNSYFNVYGTVNISDSHFIGGKSLYISHDRVTDISNINSCEFINVTGSFINGYSRSLFNMENCDIINSTNAYVSTGTNSGTTVPTNITNNRFINSPGNGFIRSTNGYVYESNNTLINCGNSPVAWIYSSAHLLNHVTVEILENKTHEIESFGAVIKIAVRDDDGNLINLGRLTVYLDDEAIGTPTFNENTGLLELKYKKLLNGTYIVNATNIVANDCTIKTATLVITPLMKSEFWVDLTGSDEAGDGSQSNPYRTLDHAMQMAEAYENIIHMGSGVFNIASPYTINTGGAIFKITGDNAVIDLEKNKQFINSISSDSVVVLENLDIVNGYCDGYGGSILNDGGNLTVNNVSFINSTANIDWGEGGAIANIGSLYVLNSKFINCTASYAGAITNYGYLYLKNNTIDNLFTTFDYANYVFADGQVDNVVVTVMGNGTYTIDGAFSLNATVTDDNGNIISGSGSNPAIKTIFYLNGTEVGSGFLENEVITPNLNLKLNGQYIASAKFGSSENVVVKTATLNFINTECSDNLWVSKEGSDETGDGSEANPFATIGKALESALTIGSTIHVKEGTYIFTSQQLISNLKNLTIKGEDDGVIISGNKQNKLFKIDSTSSVTFENLRLTDGRFGNNDGTDQGVIQNNGILYINNCTIDNNFYTVNWYFSGDVRSVAILNTGTLIVYDTLFKDNAYVVDSYNNNGCKGAAIYSIGTLEVYNSNFVGNSLKPGSSGVGSGAAIYSTNGIILKNSNFTNNTIDNPNTYWGAVVDVSGGTQSIIDNCNFYENYVQNKATGEYGGGSVINVASNALITNSTFDSNKLDAVRFSGIVDNITVTNGNGGAYIVQGILKNSYFDNITGHAISAYGSNDALAINNIITNVNGSAIQMNTYYSNPTYELTVTNNTFINITAEKGAIAAINYCIVNIYNNTIINNTATDYGDYIVLGRDGNGIVKGSKYQIIFNDNSTSIIDGNKLKLNATIIDAEGNIIYNARIFFVLDDDVSLGFADIGKDGYAYLESATSLNGTHIISGYSNNVVNPEILTGTLTISQIDKLVVYVDATMGDDETGDGSEDNPFKTLSKGLDVASSANDGTVYVVGDYYGGELNYNIDVLLSPNTNLTIIGIGEDDVIIDLTNASYLFKIDNAISSDYSNFVMKNIIIANLNSDGSYNTIVLNNVETELDNVVFENISLGSRNIIVPSCDNIVLTNCVFKNISTEAGFMSNQGCENLTIVNVSVCDSSFGYGFAVYGNVYMNNVSFINNTGSCIQDASGSFLNMLIENSVFVDNNGAQYHGGVVLYNINRNHNINVTNCVIVNNYSPRGGNFAQGYGNGLVCENNWWGTNSNPKSIPDLIANLDTKINTWIIANVNSSDINVDEEATFDVYFTLNDGSELSTSVPARLVEFTLGNNTEIYELADNVASISYTPESDGVLTIKVDNQVFTFNVEKAIPEIIAESEIDYNKTFDYVLSVLAGNKTVDNLTFTITVGDVEFANVTTDENGAVILDLSGFQAGEYDVTYDIPETFKYTATSGNYTLTINKVAPEIDVNPTATDNIIEISIPSDITENLTALIDGEEYEVLVNGTTATVNVSDLKPGKYTAVISYPGDDNYDAATVVESIVIPKEEVTPEITVNDDTITVELPEDATGYVLVDVNGTRFWAPLENGTADIQITGLEAGNYTADVIYTGDETYAPANATASIEIPEIIPEDPELKVTVENTTITVAINENATGMLIVSVGEFSFIYDAGDAPVIVDAGDLAPDTYDVIVNYVGDDTFAPANATDKVTVPEYVPEDPELKVTAENATVTISLNENATGGVLVSGIEDNVIYYEFNGEDIVIDIFFPGNYTIDVSYTGDDVFAPANDTVTVEVPEIEPVDPELKVSVENTTITVAINENATGMVVVGVGEFAFVYDAEDAPIIIDASVLAPDTYDVIVNYLGDDTFAPANATAKVTVPEVVPEDPELKVTAENATVTISLNENATGYVLVTLNDEDDMFFEFNGTNIVIDIFFPGNYTVDVNYLGDDTFAPANDTVTVEVPEIEPLDPELKAVAEDTTVTISLNENATGFVLIDVDGDTLFYELDGEDIIVDLSDLAPGNYTVEVSYSGDDVFSEANTTASVTVPEVEPADANLTAEAVNNTITVTVDENATGIVLVDVNGTGYYAPIENGQATVNVIGLDEGEYEATVTYTGDDTFAPANVTVAVTVPSSGKNDTPVDPEANINISEDGIEVTLPEDATGYVLVDVDGETSWAPVENGTASFEMPELAPGNHTVSVTYTGDKKYDSANATETITVEAPEETIFSEDLTKVEKAPDRFEANFTDAEGNPLANASVTFEINGNVYTRTTDAKGKAGMNINLEAGNYTVTITNPVTGEVKNNTITVLSRFEETNDLVKYFRNDSQYVIKVLGDDGKIAPKGTVVTFNINGVFYNRTVDESGHVKLSINLNPGEYTITAEYKGCRVSNNITVLPVLTGNDLTKKYGQAGAYEATLVDGQGKPYAGQEVEFNINGVFYKRTTDSNGVAKLNINLMPGKYIITGTYGAAAISNNVTVVA